MSDYNEKILSRVNTSLNDKIDTSRKHVDDPVPHISEEEREKLKARTALKNKVVGESKK